VLDSLAVPCDADGWEALGLLSQLRTLDIIRPGKNMQTQWLLPLARLPHFEHLTLDFSNEALRLDLCDSTLLQALALSRTWRSLRLLYWQKWQEIPFGGCVDPQQVFPDSKQELLPSRLYSAEARSLLQQLATFRLRVGHSRRASAYDRQFAVCRQADGSWYWIAFEHEARKDLARLAKTEKVSTHTCNPFD